MEKLNEKCFITIFIDFFLKGGYYENIVNVTVIDDGNADGSVYEINYVIEKIYYEMND